MNFGNFFLVSSLCNVRRDVNRCALLVLRPSWKTIFVRLVFRLRPCPEHYYYYRSPRYELEKETGQMHLDRVLHSAVFYPGDYGSGAGCLNI